MKNSEKLKMFMLLMPAMALTGSCALEEYDEPESETYTRSFIKAFGTIDPNQDWNMATQLTANIDLKGIASKDCNVKIYTCSPVNAESRLTADFHLGGEEPDIQI